LKNRNSGPIPTNTGAGKEAWRDEPDTQKISGKADALSNKGLMNAYNYNRTKTDKYTPHDAIQEDEEAEDNTESEDTEMNNSYSSSVNLDDLEDEEERKEKEK
jgi:hypothetical protein